MEAPIYNTEGKKSGSVQLPESVFGVAWNDALMHQVVTSMLSNARTPVAHVKSRGDVRGGGKKPWRQKGTGRARHGSIRSPIWKGGGVTHGPTKEKNYSRTVPRKMRIKALYMALSRKLKDNELIFIDSFGIDKPQTARAFKTMNALSKVTGFERLGGKRSNKVALIALSDPSDAATKSFRNIQSVESGAVRDLNPVSVMRYKYLVIENPEAAVKIVALRGESTKKTGRTLASVRDTKAQSLRS